MDNNLIVIVDKTGIIRFWSAHRFGLAPDDAVGRTLDLIVPPQFREAHWRGFHRAMAAGQAATEGQPTDFPLLRADGEAGEVPGRLTLLRQASGEIAGAMVIFG